MPPISIHYGDYWESIYGVMLYPDDLDMARHHVAVHHLGDAPADMDLDTLTRVRAERSTRKFDGECVGEIVKVLLTLIHHHADRKPSWQSAIKYASEFVRRSSQRGS